ncbi:MAG TPA: hypothetical protein VJN62_08230 [Gemmatimonadales bacterium]|nr:hypothetical protein [Gemmatimonadales bacterium]
MKRYAWAVMGLGLCAIAAGSARGQLPVPSQGTRPPVELRQNYPNPFNPATTIPFTLGGNLFANGHRPKVSLKIYNVLAQLVAIPILQGTGQQLDGQSLDCANPAGCSFTAYWDGNVKNGQQASSGVYIYQLVVDGQRFTKKMLIMK